MSPSKLDERVADYFSKEKTVSEWWTPDSGPLAFHSAAEIQVLAEQLTIDSSWRVLDVGTGPGRFGVFFAERGCRVTGVDVSDEMIESGIGAIRKSLGRLVKKEKISEDDANQIVGRVRPSTRLLDAADA